MSELISLLFHDVYVSDPAESGFGGEGAARYKLPLADFQLQLTKLAEVLRYPPVLVTDRTWSVGPTPVAFTVDDGGVSYFAELAGQLEERGWRGHCFITTGWIGRHGFMSKQQLRELHGRGHVIGSHSVSHPARFSACGRTQMSREWSESLKTLQDILGAEVQSASVPGGYYSRQVAETAAEAGITTLFTSEPETRIQRVAGCRVLGRYAIRRGDGHDYPARLAAASASARHAAWLKWNAKKTLKVVLGAGYPKLTARLARIERSVDTMKNEI
ncbi:MAG TPA: polysaccharide deacetylase family protein [Gammaproteobacteria bacterium]|jgi:peptidoglycan/xylan/chitin deacetylase (PgdA/CDA1 family)